jgi:hypothetical protein
MGKIVRYEFIGNRTTFAAQTLAIAIAAIILPSISILIAVVPYMIVYLLLTVVKIEEDIERPNEYIERFKKELSTK